MARGFTMTETPDPHVGRRRAILAKYPEVKALMGQNPVSALWILLLVAGQIAIGLSAAAWDLNWFLIIGLAVVIGAFPNHALYVQIHECTHNLVFKPHWPNKLLGIFCDFALGVPGAMAFRKYHLLHHKHMGNPDLDADMASQREADLIGNSTLRKAIWMSLFSVSQAMRPLKIKGVDLWDRWVLANVLLVILVDLLILSVGGPKALGYLILSTFFALGLHPLGGRWIQEHYVTKEGQETYSYYGPLNKLSFNVGYHNEHHDFANIPWNRLAELRKMAPEYYDSLKAYNSWTRLLLSFIFDPKLSTDSRIARQPQR